MNILFLYKYEQNYISSTFPTSLLVNYQEVKNAITARLNKISRKDCKDQVSCQLWLESLQNEKNYLTLFKVHENGPFLVSWVSPWQKTVSIICSILEGVVFSNFLFTLAIRRSIRMVYWFHSQNLQNILQPLWLLLPVYHCC